MTVLALSDVTRVFDGDVRALRDVSLELGAGELVGVVGPSGSGKSTLLQIMGTLDRPSSGTVRLEGVDVSSLADDDLAALRARRIGFVFQRFHLLAGLSALENVAAGLLYSGTAAGERRARAERVLVRVGLGHRLHHDATKLSGGERQRVAIARAVIADPAIVLADEPTGNLDSRAGEEIMGLLRELHRDGTTVAVITHDLHVAASLPRQIALADGRLVADRVAGRAA